MADHKGNGAEKPAAPAVNGKAYPIHDHSYDVVVVGAGGAGLRATLGCAARREVRASPCAVFSQRYGSHTS